MKITFLIPSLTIGGAEKAVSLLSNELSKLNDVYIVLLKREIRFSYGGRVYVIGHQEDKFIGKIKAYMSYYKLLRLLRPDVEISLLTKANTMNAIVPSNGRKYIWVQNFPTHYYFQNKLASLQHELKWLTIYKRVDRILATSKLLAHKLMQLFKLEREKISVLYNPININEIETLKNRPLNDVEENYFGYPTYINVGRLTWQKGQWHLIRAFKDVSKELRDSKLIIVGGGNMEKFLRSLITKLDLDNKVILYGSTLNPYKLMKRSDVFVFPSIKEGFGISLVEALACGLPTMASDCPSGPREILAPNTPFIQQPLKEPELAQYGILMPPPDGIVRGHIQPLTNCEKMWAEWMINFGQDKNLRKHYSNISPLRANDFDVKKISENLLNIIKNNQKV